jgi:predicted nucleic-acid-binding Zn-ribbon protein
MSNRQIPCPKCGHDTFNLPIPEPKLSDTLTCAKCGFSDSYERLLAPVVQKELNDAAVALTKAFNGFK